MSQQKLLKKLVEFFDAEHIPHMLTGSMASSLQGEPRSTHDALRVYEVQQGQLDQAYLQEWARKLSVEDFLRQIQREAEPF